MIKFKKEKGDKRIIEVKGGFATKAFKASDFKKIMKEMKIRKHFGPIAYCRECHSQVFPKYDWQSKGAKLLGLTQCFCNMSRDINNQ